jgi:hypothetical protein
LYQKTQEGFTFTPGLAAARRRVFFTNHLIQIRRNKMRYLYVLLIAALLLGTQPAMFAQAGAPSATVLEAPAGLPSSVGSPVIDGERDAAYGDPIASDPLGDMTEPNLDLHNLYLVEDADNYYIGFDAFASNWGMTYGIYIDTDQVDGSGATTDPWGRAVNAVSAHLPEYTLYVWHDGSDTLNDAQLNHWDGAAWNWPTLASFGGEQGYNGANDFLEYRIPKAALGNPAHIAFGPERGLHQPRLGQRHHHPVQLPGLPAHH